MSACAEAASPAAVPDASTEARAARLEKFEREKLIVEYLNRGVSVAEIAVQVGVGEKRMRAIIREILSRRMPAPPEEFVAIQVSRLNEALLVAYSAMSGMNLKAVDRVVKIVRELDRYHGFGAAAGRRLPDRDPARVAAPTEAPLAFGAALVCRAEFVAKEAEWAPGSAPIPAAPERADVASGGSLPGDPTPRGAPPRQGGAAAPAAAGDGRPENLPQEAEKVESAPGIFSAGRGAGEDEGETPGPLPICGTSPGMAKAAGDERPENRPQEAEKVESAPGIFSAGRGAGEDQGETPGPLPIFETSPGMAKAAVAGMGEAARKPPCGEVGTGPRWGGWGRSGDDGSGRNDPDPSEDSWAEDDPILRGGALNLDRPHAARAFAHSPGDARRMDAN